MGVLGLRVGAGRWEAGSRRGPPGLGLTGGLSHETAANHCPYQNWGMDCLPGFLSAGVIPRKPRALVSVSVSVRESALHHGRGASAGPCSLPQRPASVLQHLWECRATTMEWFSQGSQWSVCEDPKRPQMTSRVAAAATFQPSSPEWSYFQGWPVGALGEGHPQVGT